MSEAVIIALISTIGALIGGIASALINSRASIKAAEAKQSSTNNPLTDAESKKLSWSWGIFGVGAIIGGIAILVAAIYSGIFPTTSNSIFSYFTLVPFYRYNSHTGSHQLTTELKNNSNEWNFEAVQGYVYKYKKLNTVPLYEFFDRHINDYFYTTDISAEGSTGFELVDVVAYVYTEQQTNTIPMYRYFNESTGQHLYTVDFLELGNGGNGWKFEGKAFYVYAHVR